LDLDSTRLLHEDGHQEGVAVGYTKKGLKPCLHPLLAVLAEVRLVAQFWLRAGNASCGNNASAFFLELWENLPRHIRLRGIRADAGFCVPELLALWEDLRLPYVVVAQLNIPIQRLIKKDLQWVPEYNVHFAEVVPGRGQVDYRAYLTELSKLPLDAPLMLEHLKNAQEYDEGRAYIKKVGAEAGLAFA